MEGATLNSCMELGQHRTRVTFPSVPVCSQLLGQVFPPAQKEFPGSFSSLPPCHPQREVPTPENDNPASTDFSSPTAGISLVSQLYIPAGPPEYDLELSSMSTLYLKSAHVDGGWWWHGDKSHKWVSVHQDWAKMNQARCPRYKI